MKQSELFTSDEWRIIYRALYDYYIEVGMASTVLTQELIEYQDSIANIIAIVRGLT